MVIIISYNKQTWNEYNDSQTADENLANGAIISADRLNNMEDGIGNNDINKVNIADMRKPASNVAGIEEVSTLQTQVDNSAVGINLLTGTSNAQDYTVSGSRWASGSQSSNGTNASIPCTPGASYTYSAIVKSTTYDCYLELQFLDSGKNYIKNSDTVRGKDIGILKNTAVAPKNAAFMRAYMVLDNPVDSQTTVFNSEKLEKGSVATDWTPAPEDKVNVSDMRKPASDVVGLEDITQTALSDGTDFYTLLNTSGRPLQYYVATFAHAQTMINKPTSALSAFILITSAVNNSINTAYNYTFLNLRDVSTGDSYEALINTDGTGKITVERPWHKVADDSKVAHLSGANNFDTVPTYGTNNKPLAINDTGATTARPTGQAVGYQYFDTTLNKPIWYNGSDWVDSTGTTV